VKIIVTCGPSFEPIDQVRRLTNFSTGQLGIHLADRLAQEGFEVFCLKGSAATHPGPGERAHLSIFDTNDNLLDLLQEIAQLHQISAVFHVAALCDYRIRTIQNEQGHECKSPKIASRSGCLNLVLEPATKVISQLRGLFPESLLVGWKYELNGTTQEALAKAWRQIEESRTDACVLNGGAYGPGFAFCRPAMPLQEWPHKGQLVEALTAWLNQELAIALRHTPISLTLPRFGMCSRR
jgi:phosphopantothenoylcysteine decarboxylase/phosphopantothenate--cysteine ligase